LLSRLPISEIFTVGVAADGVTARGSDRQPGTVVRAQIYRLRANTRTMKATCRKIFTSPLIIESELS
ncbi:MAG: hypothetical protein P1U72_06295, partial [Paracoccaceae bacterium]|nr:hypothetical protein [Paracoccaceae bacterium]